jgi:uncharacterized repeat protein (TIGR03837 family)
MNSALPPVSLQWDIFCRVIDNFGDIGVCWRLATNLARRGQTVRLWTDDASALAWMAPQGAAGVQVLPWSQPLAIHDMVAGDVLVEAFGCDVDPDFVAAYAYQTKARGKKCTWINLEYLSAEPYAQRCHGLPSPIMSGPGKGLTKHFFYPGFTANTGGLLCEPDLRERQASFDRSDWLRQLLAATRDGTPLDAPLDSPDNISHFRLVSLFCYEPAGLPALLEALARDTTPTLLLVTPGRAATEVHRIISSNLPLQPNWNNRKQLSFLYLPRLAQAQFDELLWACDLNFVRGEDSLVRAIWAGKPLVWQPYPQDDGAHQTKLDAFLDWLQAPADLRWIHHLWSGLSDPSANRTAGAALLPPKLAQWQQTTQQARHALWAQNELASALISFATKNH